MWTLEGNLQVTKCDVGSEWKYTGGSVRFGQWLEIHGTLSVMWRVDGNIQKAWCNVDSGWKYTGGSV